MNKLSTCARTRPYGRQTLGTHFHHKKHTKPLLNDLKLLSVQNLFKYYLTLRCNVQGYSRAYLRSGRWLVGFGWGVVVGCGENSLVQLSLSCAFSLSLVID